jgi:hypothetical protein
MDRISSTYGEKRDAYNILVLIRKEIDHYEKLKIVGNLLLYAATKLLYRGYSFHLPRLHFNILFSNYVCKA